MVRSPLLLLLTVGCNGTIEAPHTDETDAPIIGGVTDTADPAVVMLYANSGSICTATVISPTVLLTAAHCVSPQTVGNTTFQAYFGADANKGGGTWAPVKETHYDTKFNVNNLNGGHDVAVAILTTPTSVTPKPFNRATALSVGAAVRLVGYGLNNGGAQTGAGTKRQVTTKLNQVTSLLLSIGNSSAETCNGDSGGPAFMSLGGVETLVGVTSFGQVGCSGGGWDTRIDVYASFIDQYVKGASPPPPSCTPSCSGKNCGDDGCGGSCGSCSGGGTCNSSGQCVAPPPPSAATCDGNGGWESEANDSPATANALCADGHIDGAITTASDADWYAWSVGANRDYFVTLSYLPQDYNMTLYKVVNGALSTVATAADNHDGADQQIARHTPDGGTYYLKVFGVGGASDTQWGYRVTVQTR